MALSFTNTRTRKKEPFTPREKGMVKIYTCGPTVYNVAHIGNVMAYIDADVLQRYLRYWKELDVQWVMNITDIDDKTIRDSTAEYPDMEPLERLQKFTRSYETLFFEDLVSVGIDLAHVQKFPRATDHIEEIQILIQKIWDAGYAYEKEGSIYFNLRKYHDDGNYGELQNVDFSGFQAGVRIDADEYTKDNVQDFALWKATAADEPSWDCVISGTPYTGRPGWHIECSAMANAYLGLSFDIHTGGVDLMFPHHENEIAQSTAGNGIRLADTWLHNEHLQVDGKKMSKSEGNFYTLRDLVDKSQNPIAFRMVIVSAHYRSKLNFTFESIAGAQEKIERLNELVRKLSRITQSGAVTVQESLKSAEKEFVKAMDDDLNTPEAWAVLFELVRTVNTRIDIMTKDDAVAILKFMKRVDSVFAVMTFDDNKELRPELRSLIDERASARSEKDFARADELREELEKQGIVIEDTPEGQVWKNTGN